MIKKVRKNVVFSVLSPISVFLSAAFLLSFHITTLCISSFSFFSSATSYLLPVIRKYNNDDQ